MIDKMELINENNCAIEFSDQSSSGVKVREANQARCGLGVSTKQKSKPDLPPLLNSALLKVSTQATAGFSLVALPALSSEPLIMWGCRKENCIKPELARSPITGYTDSINHHNTRNATTASSNGYNGKLANPSLFDEWWGGGFIQPIAYKQDSLVKVSITTVCGN